MSAASAESPDEVILRLVNIHTTVGALEIGVVLSAFLFGITSLQTYIYFGRFPKDSVYLKALVIFLWLVDLGHSICITIGLYTLTVTGFGHALQLLRMPNSLNASLVFSAFIGPVVQAVFAERVRRFSGYLYIPIACWVLSLFRFIGTVFLGIEALTMTSNIQFEDQWAWLINSVLAVGMATDVLVAGSLCYCLRQKQRRSTFQKTQRLVDLLTLWAIETGLLTSLVALAVLIAFAVQRRSFIWISLYCLVSRCFANSLLATLNARKKLRVAADGIMTSHSTDQSAIASQRPRTLYQTDRSGAIQIAVETTQQTGYDLDWDVKPPSYLNKTEPRAFERAHAVDYMPRLPSTAR